MSRKFYIGDRPKVVAALTSLQSMAQFAELEVKPCHLAEIRLDHVGADSDWLPLCRQIRQTGTPVILTLRPAYEGGKWNGSEDDRLQILESALPEVDAMDLELESGFILTLSHRGPQMIVSYHDFSRTPKLSTLSSRVFRGFAQGGDVVKIATMINSPADVGVLEELLAQRWQGPLCLIGMGELGAKTRYEFVQRGSCLTYGYFRKPTAPGQPSAATLMERLG